MSTQRERLMESMSTSADGHAVKLNEAEFTAPKQATGLPLSPVRRLAPAEVKLLEENSAAFAPLSGPDFERLKADIAERGILVPLIVRSFKDKTLIAGHNRLRAVLALNEEREKKSEPPLTVPVQYVETELSREQETAFVVKDNLLRRQLTAEQKESLIIRPYGKEIHKDNRGGDRGNQHTGGKSGKSSSEPLAKKIASETGIAEGTAKRILAKERAKVSQKGHSDRTGKPQKGAAGQGRGQGKADGDAALKAFNSALNDALKKVEMQSAAVLKVAVRHAKSWVKDLERKHKAAERAK